VDNPELGRKVLTQVTGHREQFNMGSWGYTDPVCGTTACIAGWAMLLTPGYSMTEGGLFYRPDGTCVHSEGDEARELLGLSDDERYGTAGCAYSLFADDEDSAIERLRVLVEAAEAAQAAGTESGS